MNRAVQLSAALAIVAIARSHEVPTGGEGSGLAAAEGEYEAIKAAAAPQRQQNLAMPAVPPIGLQTEDLRLLPGATMPEWLQRQMRERMSAKPTAQSPTWLLDAMAEQKPGAAKAAGPDALRSSERASDATAKPPPLAGDFLAQAQKLDHEAEQLKRVDATMREMSDVKREVVNPLAGFMADWMTAHDYALLGPKPDQIGSRTGRPEPTPATPDVGWSGGGAVWSLAAADQRPPNAESAAASTRLPNPYLNQLTSPLPLFDSPPSEAAVAGRDPIPAVRPEPEPSAPAPTPADAFRKSQNDGKYFRQLKRF